MNNVPNQFNAPNVPAPVMQRTPIAPLFQRKATDIVIAAVLILLSIFYVSALFWNDLQFGYTVVYNVLLILMSIFVYKRDAKFKPAFFTGALLSAVCSCSFFITTNETVRGLAFLLTILSAIIWLSSAAGKEYKKTDLGIFAYPLSVVVNCFANIPSICKSFFSRGKSRSKNTSRILIGVACSIPVLFVVVPLLLHSDEAFSALLSGFLEDFMEIILKAFLGTYVAAFLILFVFTLKYDKKQPMSLSAGIRVNQVTVSAFLSTISIVYVVYLFSQLAYFFSAFSSILPKGYKFTYAQYARRGFFELCIIAAIDLVVIYAAILLSKKEDGKIPLAVKIPSAFMVVFTFVIIFTALSKMVMYIDAYGCTVARICASAFMIWTFLLFVGILIRLFVKRLDVLTAGLIFALAIISVLGLGNVNARIAEYNYKGYVEGKIEMDVEYLYELDAEAVPYLYELTNDTNTDIADCAKANLTYMYERYYDLGDTWLSDVKSYEQFSQFERTYTGIESYSIPVQRAYEILDKYAREKDGKVYAEYYYYRDEIDYSDDVDGSDDIDGSESSDETDGI